jgi:uncharacterized repeat protein (TIGR03803 family)
MPYVLQARYAIALLALGAAAQCQAAPTETVLYSFSGTGTNPDGARPMAGLVAGPDGNLYGTTSEGGNSICTCGAVFRLTPPAQGQTTWTETVVYSFQGYPNDGQAPFATLLFDQAGNLYGTTLLGGAAQSGTIFMIQGATGFNPSETILYQFAGPTADGQFPYAGLTLDAAGALYGTTALGGVKNQGMVFKFSGGALSVLHSFAGGKDGGQPFGGVIFDANGNLFGTTSSDGSSGWSGGTVFRLASNGTETVLHRFTDVIIGGGRGDPFDGGIPIGNVTLDAVGNIYGTTEIGGSGNITGESTNAGTVYKLAAPKPDGSKWKETLLHSFNGNTGNPNTTDGANPMGGLLMDAAGNLYGTTIAGGEADSEAGTLFKLTPGKSGKSAWTFSTLYSFGGYPDGGGPIGNLIADVQGNLYGATSYGTTSPNSAQVGTVFRLTPQASKEDFFFEKKKQKTFAN